MPQADWNVRPARHEDAEPACQLLRASIQQLCILDHDNDPAVLEPWLANKQPAIIRTWIASNPGGVLVADGPQSLAGIGVLMPDGRIAVNYVAPAARFQGVSRALMHAMEARATTLGHTTCTLTSTITAHRFYRAHGYEDAGPPTPSFGGKPTYPMRRTLTPASSSRTPATPAKSPSTPP